VSQRDVTAEADADPSSRGDIDAHTFA